MNSIDLERLLMEELRLVNKHAPYEKVSLCDLIRMEVPFIVLRDGSQHILDPRELTRLHALLGSEACSLHLPLIIEYIPGEREGVYLVRDPLEAKVVASLLGLSSYSVPLFLSRPHVLELRRLLRTTTTILLNPGLP